MNTVMVPKKQHVTIKGTKEGLVFLLDDLCSYDLLIEELKDKLSSKHYQLSDGPDLLVKVESGYRYLQQEQKGEIESIITNGRKLAIEGFYSHVLSNEDAQTIQRKNQTITLTSIVRSGQVINVDGDILLIGDVNPGGKLQASGSIYIMGALRGIAHAGVNGNEDAVISAAVLNPSQLKIADKIKLFESAEEAIMSSAYIDHKTQSLQIGRVQQLVHTHRHLSKYVDQVME
ncbi:septum site-determining protein MinC [Halalkalibacter sp. APA_J-10(15)]|uniref:septum site-determining protein MinC n=1 Tax=unclassified Halalkalibacter TaxID=2893063 RepID=UPI001FF42ADB|nr:septum site-determining protein MinC [Halalkalibacter sp. APA_J-10(15)]MCK0473532.1 septum site-determining protein MinC [Halalkalibacter sp. APA_J-10(15)]